MYRMARDNRERRAHEWATERERERTWYGSHERVDDEDLAQDSTDSLRTRYQLVPVDSRRIPNSSH
jgi:hypothetical protein